MQTVKAYREEEWRMINHAYTRHSGSIPDGVMGIFH